MGQNKIAQKLKKYDDWIENDQIRSLFLKWMQVLCYEVWVQYARNFQMCFNFLEKYCWHQQLNLSLGPFPYHFKYVIMLAQEKENKIKLKKTKEKRLSLCVYYQYVWQTENF